MGRYEQGDGTAMTVTKEIVPLGGVLRGEGHERKCRIKAWRHAMFEDEANTPIRLTYSRCEIEDADEFPDGDYVLEFDGHKVLLIRKAGQYLPKCA